MTVNLDRWARPDAHRLSPAANAWDPPRWASPALIGLSVVFGIPVALIGLLFFVVLAVLNSTACWRSRRPLFRWGRIGLATSGMAFALYLIYTELFTVHAICLWCTGAHIVAFLAFVAILSADGLARPVEVAPR